MSTGELNKLLQSLVSKQALIGMASGLVILVIGYLVARKASQAVSRISHLDNQQKLLLQKISFYGLMLIVVIAALNQMGFDLKVLLGTAGFMTIALGFAAQTSASNLISGFFLIIDKPFIVGDIIEVSGIKGEVLSIDMLSCKMRTFDNTLVRVPNETLVKSEIKNLTFFPIRRIDLKLGVSYKENMTQVRSVLEKVATRNPLCLEEPGPLFIFEGFGDSSLNIQFSVWTLRENLLTLQNSILQEIKEAFDLAKIDIPFPHRTIILAEPVTVRPPEEAEGRRQARVWKDAGKDD